MKDFLDRLIVLVCIVAVAIIELEALRKGIDGRFLALALILLAGLGGYKLPKILSYFKK